MALPERLVALFLLCGVFPGCGDDAMLSCPDAGSPPPPDTGLPDSGTDSGPGDAGADAGVMGEPLDESKIIIEHNSTDEDTGFQMFVDASGWNRLEVTGPDGTVNLTITATGPLAERGLTELFFETSEPPNSEVPIPDLLAAHPEGQYRFRAISAEDGAIRMGTAELNHDIPAGPVIIAPMTDAVVPVAGLVISWQPVTETIDGDPVEIVGYELIVENAVPATPMGFSNEVMSVHVPASVTSVTVPPEFLRPGTQYEFEVLALEVGGNQTLTASAFMTE